MYGLTEGTETDDDVKKTKELLNYVNPEVPTEKLDNTRIKRIGVKKDNAPEDKPRPIKIEMDCPDDKFNILKSAKKLKDSENFKKIGLSKDKTRKEQLEYKILKDKLAEKIRTAREGQTFKIFRGQVVLEADIPEMIRKHKESIGTGWSSSAPVGGNLGGQPSSAGTAGKSDQVGATPGH